MRERKASTARQAPKLRGLDESTFGPAVAVGLDNIKYGRLHSTIVTPCGRTPDSLLSETSDFCFIGEGLYIYRCRCSFSLVNLVLIFLKLRNTRCFTPQIFCSHRYQAMNLNFMLFVNC